MTAADSPALLYRSQSLTRQLARRGLWLALVAALGLGGALALGLRTALQSLDRQLAEASMTAATTFDRFLLSLQSELIATGALLPSSRQPEAVLRQLKQPQSGSSVLSMVKIAEFCSWHGFQRFCALIKCLET